jgi:hypothetical protein
MMVVLRMIRIVTLEVRPLSTIRAIMHHGGGRRGRAASDASRLTTPATTRRRRRSTARTAGASRVKQ